MLNQEIVTVPSLAINRSLYWVFKMEPAWIGIKSLSANLRTVERKFFKYAFGVS